MKKEKVENKPNKKKKIIIISTIITVVILLIGGLSIFLLLKEPKETKELIDKVNQLNANFVKKNLSDKGTYTVGEGDNLRTCYQYIGKNEEEVLNMITDTYYIFTLEGGMFNIANNDYDDMESKKILYVCLPNNCEYQEIKKYKTVNDKETKSKKVIINNKTEAYIKENNGKKQFLVPVDMC